MLFWYIILHKKYVQKIWTTIPYLKNQLCWIFFFFDTFLTFFFFFVWDLFYFSTYYFFSYGLYPKYSSITCCLSQSWSLYLLTAYLSSFFFFNFFPFDFPFYLFNGDFLFIFKVSFFLEVHEFLFLLKLFDFSKLFDGLLSFAVFLPRSFLGWKIEPVFRIEFWWDLLRSTTLKLLYSFIFYCSIFRDLLAESKSTIRWLNSVPGFLL